MTVLKKRQIYALLVFITLCVVYLLIKIGI